MHWSYIFLALTHRYEVKIVHMLQQLSFHDVQTYDLGETLELLFQQNDISQDVNY